MVEYYFKYIIFCAFDVPPFINFFYSKLNKFIFIEILQVGSASGLAGSLTLIIAYHGLCSSGIFCLPTIIFDGTGSRNMLICKGLVQIMPEFGVNRFSVVFVLHWGRHK